jgi:hypothetical protein
LPDISLEMDGKSKDRFLYQGLPHYQEPGNEARSWYNEVNHNHKNYILEMACYWKTTFEMLSRLKPVFDSKKDSKQRQNSLKTLLQFPLITEFVPTILSSEQQRRGNHSAHPKLKVICMFNMFLRQIRVQHRKSCTCGVIFHAVKSMERFCWSTSIQCVMKCLSNVYVSTASQDNLADKGIAN